MRKRQLVLVACLMLGFLAAGCGQELQRPTLPLTIILVEYSGPEALASAERVAGELRQQGLEDVFVVGTRTQASVCCGRFNDLSDPSADNMLNRVRLIRDRQGNYPFAHVTINPVPEVPVPNPWPLERANGIYTVHVASFEARGRQQDATDFAKKLRAEGWQAYIYHGPTVSQVTIGAFYRDIFDDPRLVLRPDIALQTSHKPRIISPEVNRILRAFPALVIDGKKAMKDGKVVVPTMLVEIPQRDLEAGSPLVPSRESVSAAHYQCELSMVDLKRGFAPPELTMRGVALSKTELYTLIISMVKELIDDTTSASKSRPRVAIADIAPTNTEATKSGIAKSVTDMVITTCEAVNAVAKKKKQPEPVILVPHKDVLAAMEKAGLTRQDVALHPARLSGVLKADYVLTGTVAEIPVPQPSREVPEPDAE